jgi:hypothetical protein
MSDFVDWVEQQALENLRFHIQSAELIAKEANTTLTVLLAGVGGASAYAVKLLEAGRPLWLLIAAVVFGVCLLLLSAWLIRGCLKIEAIHAPTNEPRNIFQPSFALTSLKEVEFDNIQQRIDQTARRNERVADRLNRIRLLSLLTPLIAAVAGGLVNRLF